jgi:hypothetical protein
MRRLLLSSLFVAVLGIGLGTSAFAAASLELVTGDSTNFSTLFVTDNGGVTCTDVGTSTSCGTALFPATDQNGLTGGISLAGVVFDGFTFTITSGASNSPNCSGINGPNCLNTTNINATNISTGTATVSMYFADTGFTASGATGLVVGFSTPGETGVLATQQAYATSGTATAPNPLGAGVFNPTGGLSLCGASLSIAGPIGNTSLGDNCAAPGAPYSLELATTLTAAPGTGFNLNGTISAVPEPSSLMLLGSGLLGFAGFARRKFSKS